MTSKGQVRGQTGRDGTWSSTKIFSELQSRIIVAIDLQSDYISHILHLYCNTKLSPVTQITTKYCCIYNCLPLSIMKRIDRT